MDVAYHPAARAELAELRARDTSEYAALQLAVEKLKVSGDQLPYPHSSSVRGTSKLRELRPRSCRSRWRAFYRRIGGTLVIGAIGPEAQSNPRGFRQAIAIARERLDETEQTGRGK